jgi:uncharacterized protein
VVPGRRLAQLVLGCATLGCGVALLLGPQLGSDGFSTLVSGLAEFTGWSFMVANVLVSVSFLAMAWVRGVRPGLGTLVQILVVGGTVTLLLPHLDPSGPWQRGLMLAVAFPVLALGIALYLDSHLGAGPMEAAALAWDPPLPFAVSYSSLQLLSAVAGWQLGGALGLGTIAVIVLLGPAVSLVGRLLRLDLHQGAPAASPAERARPRRSRTARRALSRSWTSENKR